jgi:hypothetical protein
VINGVGVKTVTALVASYVALTFFFKMFALNEGMRVMGLIDSYRRTLELTKIEERLQALENAY